MYDEALEKSGYKQKVRYKKEDAEQREAGENKRRRKRKVIWFNPPFSKNVETSIAGTFLKLLDKHFPPGSKLCKIFNRNNVKVSYSCMPNIGSIIKAHNRKIIQKNPEPSKACNCRKPEECPMKGKCLSSQVVYKATVNSEDASVSYVGLAGGTFKERFNNHKKSFKNIAYQRETELSKYIWGLKNDNKDYVIEWEILKKSNTHKRQSGQCNLCLDEKLELLQLKSSINKRSELISKCRHGNEKPAHRKPPDRDKRMR